MRIGRALAYFEMAGELKCRASREDIGRWAWGAPGERGPEYDDYTVIGVFPSGDFHGVLVLYDQLSGVFYGTTLDLLCTGPNPFGEPDFVTFHRYAVTGGELVPFRKAEYNLGQTG